MVGWHVGTRTRRDLLPIAMAAIGFLALMLVAPAGVAQAATFNVTLPNDIDDANLLDHHCDIATSVTGDQCTLRAAIRQANQEGGSSTINLPADVYTLTIDGDDNTAAQGDLDITADITILGDGASSTIIQGGTSPGNGIDRVFDVQSGGKLTLHNVTVRHGIAGGSGGGILAHGDLTLLNVVLDHNTANTGGGLSADSFTTISLSRVTVSNNVATAHGGGIQNSSQALTLTNVTISGNQASTGFGGGLSQASSFSDGTLTNVTIANNTSASGGAAINGATSSNTALRNSIVANNLAGGFVSSCAGAGSFHSDGFNLSFPGTGCGIGGATGDVTKADPKLGALQDNGGAIPTQALLLGSAAIDAGNTAAPGSGGTACSSVDARGVARPQDGSLNGDVRCDIGAFEVNHLTVDATDDADDADTGNLVCATITPARCTLRAAIREANAEGSAAISLPAHTYTFTRDGDDETALNGDLDVTGSIIMAGDGPSTTVIQSCEPGITGTCTRIDRIFDVQFGASLALSGVTVRNGEATKGGGINNTGTLALTNVILAGNRGDTVGGSLANSGTATLTNVSVINNRSAANGGGIYNHNGTLSLTNVTISGNISIGAFGGGLYLDGSASSTANLTNVTIAGNSSAQAGSGINVGGSAIITLRNSIVADNVRGADVSDNCADTGTYISQGINLVFPGEGCGFDPLPGDLIGQDPKLGPLQMNGGPVPTLALLPGSAAIDAGKQAICPTTDARGLDRTADGDLDGTPRCDIGAYERASFTVNSALDIDDATPGNLTCATGAVSVCTLRAAIREANAEGGAAIILPPNLYTLSIPGIDDTAQKGDLDITGGTTIKGGGPAGTIIQGCDAVASPDCNGSDKIFEVRPGGSLTMSAVTVRRGTADIAGGGILNEGALTLTNAVLDANVGGHFGGALASLGPAATLTNVSITNNRASTGGGIAAVDGVVSMTNVTISGNTAPAGGGGLSLEGGSPTVTLTNVTIAGNGSPGGGGGIAVGAGSITLRNTIVANNTGRSGGGAPNCLVISPGAFISGGFNLVFPGIDCDFSPVSHDVLGQDPKLGPLADNGGGLPTMKLGIGSAAIDAGNQDTPLDGQSGRCATLDQRGQARTDGNNDGVARCDIGAFESVPVTADLAVTVSDTVTNPAPGTLITYTVTVSNPSATLIPDIGVLVRVSGLLTIVSWNCSAPAGTTCAPTSGTEVVEALVSLAPGARLDFTVVAAVATSLRTPTPSGAIADITPPTGVTDPNTTNNHATDVDRLTPTTCNPRPSESIHVVSAGPGRLQVTLTPNNNAVPVANLVQAVRLGTLQNAAVDVAAQPGVTTAQTGLGSGAQVTLSAPVSSLQFIVRRLAPGAFTVPLTVTDSCGTWQTFAGGGTNVP